MEIGSIFEIDPKLIDSKKHSFPRLKVVDKDNAIFLSSCREAIGCVLNSLEGNVNKVCLMPAYMCDTVFIPYSMMGWKLIFYHVNKKLVADENEIERMMEEKKPGMIFLHNYYGVETTANLAGIVSKAREKGIITILDATQSYYLTERSYSTDYIVGSLRKWYGISDGGFAVGKVALQQPLEKDKDYTDTCLELRIDKFKYLLNKDVESKKRFMSKHYEMEDYLDRKRTITAMSDEASGILEHIDEDACAMARRKNARFLYDAIASFKTIEVITYTDNAAPLYLPIYAEKRDELKKMLVENDVYTPILWPIGKENEEILSKDEKYIYDHMLAIPIDQRYNTEDMGKIINIMREFDNR